MRKIWVVAVAFLITANVIWGAATPQTKAAAKAAATQTPKVSDAQLEKAINARFAASKISTDKFKAHVDGGIATLEGYTEVVQHKGVATRLAKSAGALAVINNIEISQAAKDKAQANLDSGRRRAQVKRTETEAKRTQQ